VVTQIIITWCIPGSVNRGTCVCRVTGRVTAAWMSTDVCVSGDVSAPPGLDDYVKRLRLTLRAGCFRLRGGVYVK
jgi:hypothetical protein